MYSNESAMKEPTHKSSIENALDILNAQVSSLEDVITRLQDKAAPVLSISPTGGSEKSDRTPANSPLGDRLNGITARFSEQLERIHYVVSNLDL